MSASLRTSLLLLTGLVSLLWPIPSLASIHNRPTNCSGMDPNSVQFRTSLELSASELRQFSLPVQIKNHVNGFLNNLEAMITTGEEAHYNSCLEQLGTAETEISRLALCPWTYECDHDPARFPTFIMHARCSSELEEVPYLDSDGHHKCQCRPITYPLKVLRFVGCSPDTDLEQWELTEQIVNVGCRCSPV